MKITVTKIEIALDPVVHVWNVEIEGDRGVWKESYGSKEHVDAFLRDLQAASMMNTGSRFPEIIYVDGEHLVDPTPFTPRTRNEDVSMMARDNTIELPDFVRTHLGVEAGQYIYFVKHGDGFRVVSEAAMDRALKVETPRT